MPEMDGNPDSAQDESLILSVLQRELSPIFEALNSRISEQGQLLEEVQDLLFKFTQGLIGAADNHKRTMLGDELSSKYGKDMEPFEGFHKDLYGKGFSDSLLDELMGEGAPGDDERDAWIQNKLGEAKGKFGKYLGMGEPAPKEVESGEEEAALGEGAEKTGEEEIKGGEKLVEGGEIKEGEEEIKEGEAEEEKGEEEEEAGEGEEEDAVSRLMKEMHELSGSRHRLSEPISKKKPSKSKEPVRR